MLTKKLKKLNCRPKWKLIKAEWKKLDLKRDERCKNTLMSFCDKLRRKLLFFNPRSIYLINSHFKTLLLVILLYFC